MIRRVRPGSFERQLSALRVESNDVAGSRGLGLELELDCTNATHCRTMMYPVCCRVWSPAEHIFVQQHRAPTSCSNIEYQLIVSKEEHF